MIWTKWDYIKNNILCVSMIILMVISPIVLLKIKAAIASPNAMTTDSYSFQIIDPTPPYTDGHSPAKNELNVDSSENILIHVKDNGLGVDIDTIVMTVNGIVINPIITGDKQDYTLTYNPSFDFLEGSIIYVTVEASDLNP